MKEHISQICLEYVKLRMEGKSKEARQLLEDLPPEEFKLLYASGLDYFKTITTNNASQYLLVLMATQFFIDHAQEAESLKPNDINCLIIDGFIYNLAQEFEKYLDGRPRNSFAEQLVNDPDPEVAALGREILSTGRG